MRKHIHFVLMFIAIAVTLSAILLTINIKTPSELGPLGIAAFFLLIYLLVAEIIASLLLIKGYVRNTDSPMISLIVVSLGAAIPPVMLLALNTIRSIGWVDYLFAIIFGTVLVFYLKRR